MTQKDFSLERFALKTIQKNFDDGTFSPDPDHFGSCAACSKPNSEPIGDFMSQFVAGYRYRHHDECYPIVTNPDLLPVGYAPPPPKTEYFVVLLPGGQKAVLTQAQVTGYIEHAAKETKIIIIDPYVFDRMYPIIPLSEYNDFSAKKKAE
jgi:hypothetical protein